MTKIAHRLVKTPALAVVIAAIIASSGLVSAFDATSPRLSGTASISPTTEANPQAVMIKPAEDATKTLTAQNTLRDGGITRVDMTPPRAIPTQLNPSQPVFTFTNTDTQTVTVWITHEGKKRRRIQTLDPQIYNIVMLRLVSG